MLKRLLTLFPLLISLGASAQFTSSCADSSLKDIYYKCYDPYQPQCGCDGQTYRSPCAADYWGGMVNTKNYHPGVCGNFDFEFTPNPVSAFAITNQDAFMHIYVNENILPVSAQVYLLDVFNRVQFSSFMYITSNDNIFTGHGTAVEHLDADFFSRLEKGIYILVVSVNGEQKGKKIMKINIQ
jgi:hypothetical protein